MRKLFFLVWIISGIPLGSAMGQQLAAGPPGSASNPFHMSAAVSYGMLTSHPAPVYPEEAHLKHISGAVALSVLVAPDGTVNRVRVISGGLEITDAAFMAVRQYRYRPYINGGAPAYFETAVTINLLFH